MVCLVHLFTVHLQSSKTTIITTTIVATNNNNNNNKTKMKHKLLKLKTESFVIYKSNQIKPTASANSHKNV